MYIQTQRLIIRDYVSGDWKDLLEILSDPETMQFCEPVYNAERTHHILDYFMEKSIAYAVVLASTGKLIGHLLFSQLPPPEETGIYEIGWIFNRSYWHQGYAKEACSALIQYGFQTLHLHKITAETIDPLKSVGLMKSLGMTQEGVFRAHTRDLSGNWADVYWYAILNPMEE